MRRVLAVTNHLSLQQTRYQGSHPDIQVGTINIDTTYGHVEAERSAGLRPHGLLESYRTLALPIMTCFYVLFMSFFFH